MTDQMQDIATSYFNGTITTKEEILLERFISSNEENMEQFRQWEAEWAASHMVSSKAEQSYGLFAHRIQSRSSKHVFHRKVWRRIAASVAVLILMGGSAFTAWQLSRLRPEKYYTCTVPYGSKSCMELPDGSMVWLNAGSRLRYSDRFNEDDRWVELEGEGYFDVRKNDGKTFVVKTNACDITVKGTRFDVSAYSDDNLTSVSLMQGSVQVNSREEEMTIKPGEKVTIDKHTGKISRSVYEATANTWINNNLDFESITLGELTKILSRQFNVNFIIQSERLANTRFSVLLKQKESITDVMKALQTIQPMTVTKEDRTVYISD